MLPNIFTSSSLVWTGLIGSMVLIPLLIHLINMLRHRRVKWAAMDFLLDSHKKNRNWIWLKQLLLLLSRIAALLLVLFLIGQVGCNSEQLKQWTDSQPTHHYILLDDSFSMSERQGSQSLFDRALATSQMITARAARSRQHRVTLLRFSQAQTGLAATADNETVPRTSADIDGLPANSELGVILQERQATFDASDLSMGPASSLGVATQWMQQESNEQAIVYVLSDFRSKDWDSESDLPRWAARLAELGADIQLIDCSRQREENLAVVELTPINGMQVASVPSFMNVAVKNFGEQIARNVQVRIGQQEFPERDAIQFAPGEWQVPPRDLPTVFIEEIRPGETVTQQFPVAFLNPGEHVISATLPEDAVRSDNQRKCVVKCRPNVQVLVVGEPATEDAYYILSTFQPGRRRTGFVGLERTAQEFERMDADELAEFDLLILLDLPRLSARSIDRLEQYVNAGGGLTLFAGPNSDPSFLNRSFYRDGVGLLPLRLDESKRLPRQLDESQPDIVAESGSLFQPFLDSRNSLLNLVTLNEYLPPEPGFVLPSDRSCQVLARVRGPAGDPLVVLNRFGKGQVAFFSTSASPRWHDWPANPTFVVSVLLLQEELLKRDHEDLNRLVGDQLKREFSAEQVTSEANFVLPSDPPLVTETTANRAQDESENQRLLFALGNLEATPWNQATSLAGVYEAWLANTGGDKQVIRWTTNIDTQESNPELATHDKLKQQLAAAKPNIQYWDQISSDPQGDRSRPMSKWLLVLLVGFLFGEQLLAYLSSYHPSRRSVA